MKRKRMLQQVKIKSKNIIHYGIVIPKDQDKKKNNN